MKAKHILLTIAVVLLFIFSGNDAGAQVRVVIGGHPHRGYYHHAHYRGGYHRGPGPRYYHGHGGYHHGYHGGPRGHYRHHYR